MSLVRLGPYRVHAAKISMPVRGAWHADVDVDADVLVEGERLELVGPGIKMSGTARRAGHYAQRGGVRLYAGADGLRTELKAVSYRRVFCRQILADLARETGEAFSLSSDAANLSAFVERFTRPRGTASDCLAALLDVLPAGTSWRSLDDGMIWIGQPSWPTTALTMQTLDDDIKTGVATLASETAELRPGVVFDGRRITRVEHTFEDALVRTEVEYTRDSDESDGSRMLTAFTTLVRRITRGMKFHARRVGTILSQEASGRVAVKLDGADLPGAEGVQLRYGLPGFKAKVPAGTRCTLQYEEGDGRKPVVTSFDGDHVDEVSFDGGTRPVARIDDTTDSGTISWAWATAAGVGTVTLSYMPSGGTPTVFLAIAAPGLTVAPTPTGSLSLPGKVTSGNVKLKA
jgi:hypothetical protein